MAGSHSPNLFREQNYEKSLEKANEKEEMSS